MLRPSQMVGLDLITFVETQELPRCRGALLETAQDGKYATFPGAAQETTWRKDVQRLFRGTGQRARWGKQKVRVVRLAVS